MSKLFSFPPFEEFELGNGFHCILLPHTEQDVIVIAIQFPFGRFADPVGFEGCVELCIGLMQKGTVNKTCEEFLEQFEQRGAVLFSEVGEEHTIVGVKMLSCFVDALFPCFWEMVTSPRLDPRELDRLKKEMITALRAETIDPGVIASRHFFNELATSRHPAGRYATVSSVRRIDCKKVTELYNEYIVPADAALIVAGNFNPDRFEKKFIINIKSWKKDSRLPFCEAPATIRSGRAVRFVEKNDLTQASILIGQTAPGELDQRRNMIAIANYILGGGNFSSRLMTRIRSSEGKTYGIVSNIASGRRFGAITISTATRNNQLEEVLSAILNEYDIFCREGITEEELEKAKKYAIGNMAFQLEGIMNIVEKLLWLRFYRRTPEYLENFGEMISSISLDLVNETIKKCFNPEDLIIVAVGNKNETLHQLDKFGKPRRFHYKDKLN